MRNWQKSLETYDMNPSPLWTLNFDKIKYFVKWYGHMANSLPSTANVVYGCSPHRTSGFQTSNRTLI